MHKAKWTLKRMALGVALSIAVTAVAFFAASYLSDGEFEGQTGKNTDNFAQPVNIQFADGVSPSNPVEVSAEVENTSGGPRVWQSFVMDIETPTVPVCGEDWLTLRPEKSDGTTSNAWLNKFAGTNSIPLEPIPVGTHSIFDYSQSETGPITVWLEFDPALVASTDQSSCEDVPVIVRGSLTE